MIDKNKFKEKIFLTTGIVDYTLEHSKARVGKNWTPNNNNSAELRAKVRDIMWDQAEKYRKETNKNFGDYVVIEECCRIPTDTMKKAVSGRYKITRNFLAKFTVGLKLNIDNANSLFRIHSGELNLTNDFDYITYHALDTKDEIDEFIQEVEELLGINLDRTR